jgi:hypothetical protein
MGFGVVWSCERMKRDSKREGQGQTAMTGTISGLYILGSTTQIPRRLIGGFAGHVYRVAKSQAVRRRSRSIHVVR